MKVYKLTEELITKAGIYNNISKFEPIEDADGNMVCGLGCGENANYPFADNIKKCEQIDFNPKIRQTTPISPPSGPATDSFNGLHRKSNYLAIQKQSVTGSLFWHEGRLLPENGNIGCLMVIGMISNPLLGAGIIFQNILKGIPLEIKDTGVYIIPMFIGVIFFGYSLLALIPIFTGKDTIEGHIRGYSEGNNLVNEYLVETVEGSYARRRGIFRLCFGLFFPATLWIPYFIAGGRI